MNLTSAFINFENDLFKKSLILFCFLLHPKQNDWFLFQNNKNDPLSYVHKIHNIFPCPWWSSAVEGCFCWQYCTLERNVCEWEIELTHEVAVHLPIQSLQSSKSLIGSVAYFSSYCYFFNYKSMYACSYC